VGNTPLKREIAGIALLLFAGLMLLSSTAAAPFIYTLF
jgi:hypothetical protein